MDFVKATHSHQQICKMDLPPVERRLLMLVSLMNRGMPLLLDDSQMVCDIMQFEETDLVEAIRNLQARQAQ